MSSRLNIFLAEDNVGDILLVREALTQHDLDFELFVAEDGDKAASYLERLGTEFPRPDVLLLDLNLPRVEGPELFRRVRKHPLCADVPIVVVTSSDSPSDRAWTKHYGVAHYFRKPSDFQAYMQLGAVVRKLAESTNC